jgi:Mg2+ and Co2+ transporter CorA
MSSKKLLQHMNECRDRFEKTILKPEKTEALFYKEVRPKFELVMNHANIWKPLAEAWVKEQQPKYIHLSQIESTIDNIEQIVLQSFYKDVNKQRFHNLHHSVEYIIKSIVSELNEID